LNATGISSWSSVQLLEQYLPAIEELYLTDNDLWDMPYIDVESMNNDVNGAVSTSKSFISGFTKSSDTFQKINLIFVISIYCLFHIFKGFKSLRILDISSCKIDEWGKIRSLGKLPVLQQLLLDDNPITIIPPNTKDCFVQLSRVSLSSTK
jgi:Leucine-rich repeat (LRR) protein